MCRSDGLLRNPVLQQSSPLLSPMKELCSILAALERPAARPAALATLCRVHGSSYRRPGARLLLGGDGARTGSISGGCLEDDVILRARAVAGGGPAEAVTYDTTDENDLVWGVGLGCHGVVDLVVEPLGGGDPDWAACLRGALARRQDAALAVVFQAEATAALGTRAALTADGREWAVTGAERAALADGLRGVLANQASHQARIETLPGRPWVFFEYAPRPAPLLILGAGDDAQPLCRMAAELGFAVTVIDPRPAYASKERFPAAETVLVAAPGVLARRGPADGRAAAVVMTHHYVHDGPFLRWLLERPPAYIGLLGPKQRAEKILADLAAGGLEITPVARARLHAPVGLDLGAQTPETVALAILAEVQAVLAGRDARPLRDRTRPIHD
jgi:xanthine/CO dehydrogenase XdhC/CoxF family maturation factor